MRGHICHPCLTGSTEGGWGGDMSMFHKSDQTTSPEVAHGPAGVGVGGGVPSRVGSLANSDNTAVENYK